MELLSPLPVFRCDNIVVDYIADDVTLPTSPVAYLFVIKDRDTEHNNRP